MELKVSERFVSEPVIPVADAFDAKRMSVGEPGLPREFLWRNDTVQITQVLRTWRTTKSCRHGSGEQYVRRHWFEIKTAGHGTMKIYFDKGSRGGRKEMGWWIFSVCEDVGSKKRRQPFKAVTFFII